MLPRGARNGASIARSAADLLAAVSGREGAVVGREQGHVLGDELLGHGAIADEACVSHLLRRQAIDAAGRVHETDVQEEK